MPFLLIYVTHPSKPEAAILTSQLLNARLIACANYISIESVFWWEGFLTKSDEIATLYKTRVENWDAVKEFIEKNHKYEVPCIIKLATVEANEKYEAWIQSETDTYRIGQTLSKSDDTGSLDSLFQK